MGIANSIPSILSSTPPCPGNKSLVSLTFALRFSSETKRSPICDTKEIIIVITINEKKLWFVNSCAKKGIENNEKINEPIDPDIVFFGLILVSFLPLKDLPTTKPPMSDKIEIKIE